MSTVFKKLLADKIAFKFDPKAFHIETSNVAKDFVSLQAKHKNDFRVADVVAEQSGISELNRKNLEAQVEETVLERIKEIQEQSYRQAYDLGLIEGTEKAFEEKRMEFADRLQRFDSLIKTLEATMVTSHKESETILIKLVYEIAKRIAMREIQLQTDPIAELLTQLVAEVQSAEQITVRLNSEDQKYIDELRERKVKSVENLERVKLQSVDDITRGGCVIETNYGAIDATVEQRAEKAWTVLAAKLPLLKKDGST